MQHNLGHAHNYFLSDTMARDLSRLLPCVYSNFSNNSVAMKYFRGQQLEDAINCSQKFTALLEKDINTTPLSEFCLFHPQMKLDMHCKQCGVDVCRECTTTEHRRHEYTTSSDMVHEETRRLGEATNSVVELLEEMKRAISGVKEMKQRVRNRKDNNINVTREVFATLRKAIDEREEQTVDDIKEAAYEREKALEVSHLYLRVSVNLYCVVIVTNSNCMFNLMYLVLASAREGQQVDNTVLLQCMFRFLLLYQ